tara:strand:- start:50 stop:301 length:252 start_codon:yes stop_codon:yes gene_type:complete
MSLDKEKRQVLIGERLKELRISKGYTSYRNFALEYEFEPKQIWKLEEGKSDFKISTLFRILDIYDMSIQEFFNGLELELKTPE